MEIAKKIKEITDDKNQLEEFHIHIEELKKKRYLKQHKGKDEDFIQRNKSAALDWTTI